MSLSTGILLLLLLVLIAWVIIRPLPRMPGFGDEPRPSYAERLAAQARAEELLRSVIGPECFVEVMRRGYLEVPSPSIPSRVYRVPSMRGQVEVYEDGLLVMKLCVVPTKALPDGDVVLMHKLMIEANEDYYLKVANRFGPVPYSFYR
ncbi:MAG: hypothetical protein IT340_13875 [Chloroflexi bacterium]|nr:hypothetical protein [Chloroflexota bacterium]